MAWKLPEGYEVLSGPGPSGMTMVVARRARAALLEAGLDRPEDAASGPAVVGWVGGGRARHPVVRVGDESWILKAYRRGGLLARWNPDLYWRTGRFLRELWTTVSAAQAGVPAPEPIALILRPAGWGGAWRAWQVVRFVPGVSSLREVLDGRPAAKTSAPDRLEVFRAFRAAGSAVRKMHEAQIDHPDLNVGNILTRAPAGTGGASPGVEVYIVDWDRARRRPRGSWNPHRNLLRLWRSALKLARLSRPRSLPDSAASRADSRAASRADSRALLRAALRAFLHGYFGRDLDGLRALRGYLRPRRAMIALHAALWEVERLGRVP